MKKPNPGGRPPIYPWDKWLSRRREYLLFRGKDYTCQSHGMAQQIRNKASEAGLSVSIYIHESFLRVRNYA